MGDERFPGRRATVRGFLVSNASRRGRREWGVRFGTAGYPDYAVAHPTRWDGQHGGTFLTPDEADELARHLRHVAAWARAQQVLEAGV